MAHVYNRLDARNQLDRKYEREFREAVHRVKSHEKKKRWPWGKYGPWGPYGYGHMPGYGGAWPYHSPYVVPPGMN